MRQRRDWFARQLDLDPTRLVFIDETWASTNMARMRGRCRRGRRLRAAVPHGHYKTVTLVAGLRLCGLVAQKAFDRPINAASFEEWVEKCLVPTLSKGDIVVMDNLSSHKGPRVEQLIKAAGAELRYLPPYSPDMNPIEKAYSKLKAFLRKIAERTVAGPGCLCCARIRQIRSHQEARHKSAKGHQSVHKRANSIQGEAGAEDHQGSPSKGYQRCSGLAPRTLIDSDVHRNANSMRRSLGSTYECPSETRFDVMWRRHTGQWQPLGCPPSATAQR